MWSASIRSMQSNNVNNHGWITRACEQAPTNGTKENSVSKAGGVGIVACTHSTVVAVLCYQNLLSSDWLNY